MSRVAVIAGGGLAAAALAMSLEAGAHDALPRGPRRKWIAGPHEAPATEPQREDYPSRQAWRQDYRRWQKGGIL